MSSRLYRPRRDDRVAVGQDVLRQHARSIATGQLLPRIAKQNQIAVETIQTAMWFYSKIPAGSGRRCSCFDVEVSPNSSCRCCWGTGVVGGYEKYGTNLEILDVTHPSIRAFNIIPDYSKRSRPRQFVLIGGARRGHLISRMQLKPNIGEVDHIFALREVPGGTTITAFLRAPVDPEWVVFTTEALEQRLMNPWIDIKIELERASIAAPSPRFGMLFCRYNRLVDRAILANIPRTRKSNMLQEFGVIDDWQEQQFWTDNTLRSITTEDWIASIDENTRWKINGVNDFSPEGKLLSWDLDTRLIQSYEAASLFPL